MKVLIDGQTLSTPEMRRGIGSVFRKLLEQMVVPEVSIRWHIVVRDLTVLQELPEQVAAAMEPVQLPAYLASGPQTEWCRAYGRAIASVAKDVGADLYWNPNPLMPNVHFPLGLADVATAWTLHDLIPLKRPEWYLDRWPAELADDYRARLQDLGARKCLVLTDSVATGGDFRSTFPGSPARLVTAHCASDYSMMYPLRCGSHGAEPYVLYVGGFDPRKNMEGAISAFSKFHAMLREGEASGIRLKVVCAHNDAEAESIYALAQSLGVRRHVELLGYVDEERLGELFRSASVFFFPSFYEGFGLPVLDALGCGVPVVCADNSSLPEVCGDHAYYADASDDEGLASQLLEAWRARQLRRGPWTENANYARQTFDWKRSASIYLQSFRNHVGEDSKPAHEKPTIAYLSPWPPQRTGVADYSYGLVRHLSRHARVIVFTNAKDPLGLKDVEIRPLESFEAESDALPRRVYHVGNNLAHSDIYRLAWRHPGIVVLHDYNIHPFMAAGFAKSQDSDLYRLALEGHGAEGVAAYERYEKAGTWPDIWSLPLCDALVQRSAAALVHSRWVARRLHATGMPVVANHLGAELTSIVDKEARASARRELGLRNDAYYVGALGFINSHKRLHIVAEAVGMLRRMGYPVSLAAVGEVNDGQVSLDQFRQSCGAAADATDGFIHVGYVSERDYDKYLAAIDVLVNLRYPTMGESSASLFRAMARAVPAIVSDTAQFRELPDAAVWKVKVGPREAQDLAHMLEFLFRNAEPRTQLGLEGRGFVRDFGSMERTAAAYVSLLR